MTLPKSRPGEPVKPKPKYKHTKGPYIKSLIYYCATREKHGRLEPVKETHVHDPMAGFRDPATWSDEKRDREEFKAWLKDQRRSA